jgi:cell division septation protein DedD
VNRKHTWLAWALAVGLVAYLAGAAIPGRSTVTLGQDVKAYATGTALHADAIQAGLTGPRLADVEEAFSAVNVDSQGFGATSRQNENEVLVQPNPDDNDLTADPTLPDLHFEGKNASARGAGLELGVGSDVPTPAGEIINETRSNAVAPPDTGLASAEDGPVPGDPLVYAALLHSDALAQWEGSTCGRNAASPIAYSRGYAANAQLVDAGTKNPDGSMGGAVVGTDAPTPDRNAATTTSFVYPFDNLAGGYGLISEVHQTYAPVSIANGPTGPALIIEVLGEWFVKTTVSGLDNGATIKYGVLDRTTGDPVDPGATVIRISPDGGATYSGFSLQDLMDGGVEIPLDPIANIMLGEDLRAISAPGAIPDPDSSPTLEGDGTRAAGAVDVVRIKSFNDSPVGVDSHLADLRIGHFESDLEVPAGGFQCDTPTTTTTSTTTSSTSSTSTSSTSTSSTSTSTTSTSTTVAPTSTTSTSTTVKPTTTTSTTPPPIPPPEPPATPVRVQPSTVG